MNAVEIEEAITQLAEQPFNAVEFPYAFLEAFGNKPTTISRLRSGSTNKTDVEGAVLQYNTIHMAVCSSGEVPETLDKLKNSSATARQKAKFILVTDGIDFQAEDLSSGETVACAYKEFPDHFGFFLPLAGISTVKQISENAFDIRATSRLNKLYVELLRHNPEWGTEARRHDMNHFMARLIFCFFAEDTDIFNNKGLFTSTIAQMSATDSTNTHKVISEIFRAMNTKKEDKTSAGIPRWAEVFPYVNGGLFSGSTETPRFSRIARTYILHVGNLDWTKINPDIFGSMIQAVADDEERGALGMHYTSVPNILKVLNPLFLDDLREKLEEADDNSRKLLNLRNRIAKIRVFDPACGSGNFLVIAYKEMRKIEAEINKRRGEEDRRSDIPLTNFRGIEIRDFAAEVARLALIIAEFQCDVLYRGRNLALAEFLPLDTQNWITCGNALRLDWLAICPPTGTTVKLQGDDLFNTPLDQPVIDFENEGGETYVCGNPPYKGTKFQTREQKEDIRYWCKSHGINAPKSLDLIAYWFLSAAVFCVKTRASCAFVSTNSICQGGQVDALWPFIFSYDLEIFFAYSSFPWKNLATNNAAVIVVVVGIRPRNGGKRYLFSPQAADCREVAVREVASINAYLAPANNVIISSRSNPISCNLNQILTGGIPRDNNFYTLDRSTVGALLAHAPSLSKNIKMACGGAEFIRGTQRTVLFFPTGYPLTENEKNAVKGILDSVKSFRETSSRPETRQAAQSPEYFSEDRHKETRKIFIPQVFSENRDYITAGYFPENVLVLGPSMQLCDAELYEFSVISSRMHIVWISTVCGKLKNDFRYSNTLGWNTFPVPLLTEKMKTDLTSCAEDILLAREAHFPATIADLYDPDNMPENLRHAHERNDEVLERIYIGRRFKNDTERLEKLFELYTKMTSQKTKVDAPPKRRKVHDEIV